MPSQHRYEVVEGWEQLPAGYKHLDVAGVAVDSRDRVYIITRTDPRVIVYERDGTFVMSWGDGMFTPRAHGITIGPDDSVYCVDDGDQTVRKFTTDGKLLMTLGTSGVASDTGYDPKRGSLYESTASITHGGPPFNRPTNVAVAPSGELYVSDGYGNARVHRFSADGKLIHSWGEPGTGPGQFNLPHSVWVTGDGRVLVADRESDRIQIFTLDGAYLGQWTNVQRPTDIFINRQGLVYVSELPWRRGDRSFTHGPIQADLPGRVSVFDKDGNILARLGGSDGSTTARFCATHGVCLDSRGDIYVAEVTHTFAGLGGKVPVPPYCRTLQKLTRKG